MRVREEKRGKKRARRDAHRQTDDVNASGGDFIGDPETRSKESCKEGLWVHNKKQMVYKCQRERKR